MHTAITLFRSLPSNALATAYLGSSHDPAQLGTLVPPPSEPAHIWLCHALPLALCSLIPLGLRGLLPFLHPLLPPSTTAPPATTSPPPDGTAGPYGSSGPVQVLRRVLTDGIERDAVWDVEDPWPWWHLAHVQWPAWFLSTAFRGQGWSRVNVSTGRIFAT